MNRGLPGVGSCVMIYVSTHPLRPSARNFFLVVWQSALIVEIKPFPIACILGEHTFIRDAVFTIPVLAQNAARAEAG